MGAAPPGAGGGMGDLFGGGGAGGMPTPGGEMPGAGGMGVGGPEVGGAPGGAAPPAGGAAMGGTQGKILPTGRASKLNPPKEEIVQPAGVKLTSLEQVMWKILLALKQQGLPFATWTQFPLGKYRTDFALPQLKLAIECDGEAWHSHPDKKASDHLRDAELAKYGWTTVRFSEVDLKEQEQAVKQTLLKIIYQLWEKAAKQQEEILKKASKEQEDQKKQMQKIQEVEGEIKTSSVGTIISNLVQAGTIQPQPVEENKK